MMETRLITNGEAREKFGSVGLSYANLDEPKIRLLYAMLSEELKFFREHEDDAKMGMTLSQRLEIKVSIDGHFQHAFMYADGSYFEEREAISFNPGGFIGFGGWASGKNVQPMLRAFIRWCDVIGQESKLTSTQNTYNIDEGKCKLPRLKAEALERNHRG